MARFLFVLLALLLAPAARADVPVGELADAARPLAYRIALRVDPARERFSGETEIDVELKAPAATLFLHGRGLTISRAEAVSGSGAPLRGTARQVHDSGVLELRFARPLAAGRHRLRFVHDARFMTAVEGLYRVQVGGRWYAWTQFQAIDARRVFPGFDEPRHKTPFTLSLTVPDGLRAFANTPEVAARPDGRGWTRHDFAPSEPLPTYLVALAVGDFDVVEATIPPNAVRARPLPFRAIATKGQAPRLAFTLAETPRILALAERYFGTPYPFAKLDVIASPIMGGAMENVGLVTFDDTLLLLDADAPLQQVRSFGVVMAHELAHMWFGNLVTPRWWDDIWLNESFATWMGNQLALEWRPDLGVRAVELAEALDAMDEDSLAAGRPVRQPITDSSNINAAFDRLTYQKGGQIIRMFERYLGPETFQRGVRLHLDRFRFGTADADAFFASMAEASGNPGLVAAWRSFVDQEGVPLVQFTPAPGGAFGLAQSRYAPIGGAADDGRLWRVPVCASSGEGVTCTLLEERAGRIGPVIGTAPWVAGNASGAGYYRFDLPAADWSRLLAAGATLPAAEAMTAADSIWAGFAAGTAPFARVLAAAEAFAPHPERLVATWLAFDIARVAREALPQAEHGRLEARLRTLYGPQLAALGLDPARGRYAAENPDRRQLRQSLVAILALDARDPAVRATLRAAAEAALAGRPDALDPALRPTALRVLAEEGGPATADRLRDALVASDDPLFRRHAASALGSQPDAAGAAHVLGFVTDPRLQNLEALAILGGLFQRPATRAAALAFVDRAWERLRPRVGGLLGGFAGAASGFCSEADAREVERVFRPKLAALGAGSLELDRPLAAIRRCAALQAATGADVRRSFGLP